MVILQDFNTFAGRHRETGTIHNALAYQGITAPHTGEAYSEALLMGVSGGAAFGYFTFEYTGYPPQLVLLSRNTFDPLDTLLERLAIPRDVTQTASADKGTQNLRDVLEGGRPAIVWADMFTLPYNDLAYDENNWGVYPLLVYGLDDDNAYLADRANVPLTVAAETLQAARTRIKKDKSRVMALHAPDASRLPSAVSKGIWQCISLYTDGPPKGKRENFGLAALDHWAKMLTNTRNKQSWARYFPPGERLWSALAGTATQPGVYGWIMGADGSSFERGLYADFLAEAAAILEKPDLNQAADLFRKSDSAWTQLAALALPQDVPLMAEAADLLRRKEAAFIEHGADALDEIRAIKARLQAIHAQVSDDFPLSDDDVTALFARLAEQVRVIHDIEREAVTCLQSIMA